jgi:hypothetical protein
MTITIKYQSDTFMPYELRAIIEKYKGMICKCDERYKNFTYMNELCKEITCWLSENADSATSPCDNCNENPMGLCSIAKREHCDKYRVYASANANRMPRGG